MSTSHSTCATEKDLLKFLKFLAFKSIQVIVQSRLGELLHTPCGPPTGNDWFNIVVDEHPEINADTKWGFSLKPGETILQRLPFFIEISLKTSEGDTMILEVWSMDVQRLKDCDKNDVISEQCLKQSHSIYNRMGVLLKSLITLSRATPAYKLSRHQCADSYRIHYRIYFDQPQLHTLGEGHKFVRIGQLNTILGNLVMSLAYRTKMTITPTTTVVGNTKRESNVIMMDSNHFRPLDGGPRQNYGFELCMKKGHNGSYESKIVDIEKPLRPGAFTDIAKIKQYTEDDFILPETPPFEWLLRKPRLESTSSGGTLGSIESLNRKCDSPVTSPLGNGYQHNINNNVTNNNNNNSNNNCDANVAVTANNNNNNNNVNNHNLNGTELKNNPNCENVLQQIQTQAQKSPNNSTVAQAPSQSQSQSQSQCQSQSQVKSLFIPVAPTVRLSSAPHMRRTHAAALSANDENLLKELNFPFASHTSHVNDLAKFYRDCYHAPPLRGLSISESETINNVATTECNKVTIPPTGTATTTAIKIPTGTAATTTPLGCNDVASPNTSSSTVDDLSQQLEQFETSLEDYDKLVSQFGILSASSSSK